MGKWVGEKEETKTIVIQARYKVEEKVDGREGKERRRYELGMIGYDARTI